MTKRWMFKTRSGTTGVLWEYKKVPSVKGGGGGGSIDIFQNYTTRTTTTIIIIGCWLFGILVLNTTKRDPGNEVD